MDVAPDAINVIVKPDDKTFNKDWKYGTLKKGLALIPILQSQTKAQKYWIRGGQGFDHSFVSVTDLHEVELAFAVTFHKAQGRTLKRIILALLTENLHWNAIKKFAKNCMYTCEI